MTAKQMHANYQAYAFQDLITSVFIESTVTLAPFSIQATTQAFCGNLRVRLRKMDLWKDMVKSNEIPTDDAEKLKYNAERVVCSAIVQEYHVMIQEGLEYSYVTTGIARVLLRVLYDNLSTLYYFLCDPNREIDGEIDQTLQYSKTLIARVLCLCLMAFRSSVRHQEWRHATRSQLPLWRIGFEHTRSQIPKKPFKLTCTIYGYTVLGKGTTAGLWKEVSREAQVYQILRKAQGSAVPVFLGTIDLAKIYFLHGAGEIRHLLVMGWGGESTSSMELKLSLLQEIGRLNKETQALGIIHDDFRRENILWNEEVGRALIIDFHRSMLKKSRPTSKRLRAVKRQPCPAASEDVKRKRVL
ncbi:hypothetical protein N7509_007728 [Penicillium cosmopolitanum]|uniref:Protein kinase domain-containing protein n=1 Tax=Penicillium cosmopolitanum TaxID=1131564 RepID=A0A9W9VZE4_9EURO|nr:uncharacterized protein N7509_007728 [Penicillium cosmopolitanum]KAJ5392238.1 hypothetical protein N7509_007728 [Penicillium cosmopolitanum]